MKSHIHCQVREAAEFQTWPTHDVPPVQMLRVFAKCSKTNMAANVDRLVDVDMETSAAVRFAMRIIRSVPFDDIDVRSIDEMRKIVAMHEAKNR